MLVLFTTPSCPQCPSAKTFLQEKKIDNILVDASKPEGLALARNYGLSSVPSLVLLDEKGHKKFSLTGLGDIISHLDSLCSSQDSKK